ncbi:hypothetical protein EMPS_07126 [Entomortierella parvispora]|uniref:F-box domain-containing protein n=1 Tax=Entomortierella parvispora TaxID=205924 RepID=A0A9P3LY56_9FUNG|nr:hypothetical protein EMPS_07126 [Entomortierella parvispora]
MQVTAHPHPQRVASLSTLPPECLELILQNLRQPNLHDRGSSLARLMQVNSYFCSAALPYLYGSVFRGIGTFGQPQTLNEARCFKALQTVLRHRPAAEISDLLSAAYDIDRSWTGDEHGQGSGSARKIDYLSAIHTFNPSSLDYAPLYCFDEGGYTVRHDWRDYPQRLADMVFRSKENQRQVRSMGDIDPSGYVPFVAPACFGEGAFDENLPLPPRVCVGHLSDEPFRYAALSILLRREVTWTVCSPILEQIQDLVIPLSDVHRYLDVVHRFRSLKSVQFKMDELLQPPMPYERQSIPLTQRDVDDMESGKQRQYQQFSTMVQFVRKHCELFPNLLNEADCPDDFHWPRKMSCPSDIIDEMKLCLPPLHAPTLIWHLNWKQVLLKLIRTDLSHVETIHLLNSETDHASALLWKSDPTFLARCRSLQTLNIFTIGPSSFSWAVKEKKAWDLHQADMASQVSRDILTAVPPKEPAPLKQIRLITNEPSNEELDDAIFAFGNTLEIVQFNVDVDDQLLGETAPIYMGRGWNLPNITHLTISMPSLRLLACPGFYQCLGNKLQQLLLVDRSVMPYMPQDTYTCRPFLETMPDLTKIRLHWKDGPL